MEAARAPRRRRRDEPTPGEAQARLVQETRDRYLKALEWAKRHLPDEHAPFAASAAMTLRKRMGSWPSPDAVRARLVQQGRSLRQLEGK